MISYLVSARTHEIGIRLAVGAQLSNILRIILGQGLTLALAGAPRHECGSDGSAAMRVKSQKGKNVIG